MSRVFLWPKSCSTTGSSKPRFCLNVRAWRWLSISTLVLLLSLLSSVTMILGFHNLVIRSLVRDLGTRLGFSKFIACPISFRCPSNHSVSLVFNALPVTLYIFLQTRPQSLGVCGQRWPSAQCSVRNQKLKTKVSVRWCACVRHNSSLQMRSESNRCK